MHTNPLSMANGNNINSNIMAGYSMKACQAEKMKRENYLNVKACVNEVIVAGEKLISENNGVTSFNAKFNTNRK